jgi:hypothetical protein
MQPMEGRCPECGAPARLSASGFYLRFAAPEWIKRLARGSLLMIVAIGGGFVSYFVVIAAIMALVFSGMSGPTPTPPNPVVLAAVGLIPLAFAVVLLVGVYLLTSPDPARGAVPERLSARRLARWCIWPMPIAIVGGFAVNALNSTPLGFGPIGVLAAVMLAVTAVASLISGVIMPAAVLRHFMNLMRRVPRPGLVTFAKIEFWGYVICSVLFPASYTVMIFTMIMPMTAAARSAAAAAPATGPTASGPVVTVYAPGAAPTTMPTTAFAPFASAAGALVSAAVTGLAGCGGTIVGIAGLVLLIMVWRTLADAAREATHHAAAVEEATSRGGAPQLPAG